MEEQQELVSRVEEFYWGLHRIWSDLLTEHGGLYPPVLKLANSLMALRDVIDLLRSVEKDEKHE